MKYRLLNILLLTLFLSTALIGADAKVIQVERPELRSDVPEFVGYVPDEIVVKFKPAAVAKVEKRQLASGMLGLANVDQMNQKYSATKVSEMFPNAKPVAVDVRVIDLSGYYKIRFSQSYEDIEQIVTEYQTLPEVEKAEAIGIHTVHAVPNDGNYSSQWHLNQSNDHDVDAPEAWDIEDGSSQIIVGVLDTGVRYFHKDLGGSAASYSNPQASDGNMWINDAEKNGVAGVDDDGNGFVDDWIGWDFVDDAGDTRNPVFTGEDGDVPDNDPRDFNGHGTHCAGNVAAINNNGYATAAVSGGWGGNGNGVKVMALRMGYSAKYLRRYEVGLVRMDYAAQAFYYAANNGAHIVTCSWGSSNSGGIADAISYYVAQGGLVFNSAGNDGTTTASYVASRSDVVAVASTDQNDCKSDFSNYGTWVDISSPGTAIMSLYHNHEDAANDYVATMDGTSMASPIAASVAALIWSQNRSWSASDVRQRLYDTADDIYGESCNSSYSNQLGAGRVNAFAAVNGGGTPGDPPVAAFTGTPTSGTAPLTVNFTDQSTNTPTSWSWNFGDGGTSTVQNPSHQYTAAGVYTVTLTATNAYGSDGETKTNYITVGQPPVAAFTGTPTSGTAPLTVNFTDQSTNTPTSWSWNFGDGGTSTVQNPSHQYTAAGVYTVTLTATNAYGSDGETKTNYITVTAPGQPPVAAFVGTPTSGTAPLTVNFTDQSTNTPTSWSWNFGDGGTSTSQNPSHQYTAAGVYTVTLTATNAYGSDGETKTNYITVNAPAQNLMHVNAIEVTKEKWFVLYRGKARVQVVDAAGNPVASASVTGNWSGGATTSATFTTGTDGWGTTYAAWRWGDASYTFCVSNITKSGWTYDASANVVSCGSTNNMIEAATTTSKVRLDEMDEEVKSKLAFSYPNPFNATTVISFYVPENQQVTVEIYNVLGEKITTLVNQHLETGVHSINWNSTNDAGTLVGSGTYFFKVNIGNDYTMMRKMILLK